MDSLDLESEIDTYAKKDEDKRVSRVSDQAELAADAGVDPTIIMPDGLQTPLPRPLWRSVMVEQV